ncbi:hypothetical protein AAJ76_3700036161 [Vairimorpha ceranae]|uniref:Transcription and mRNA export factor SUS1 n=1 Tax=Vairimorpha ceranae TaxID=40302 RepID=A0A0F9WPV9_9MICR|nr:hypothetical protein AAJ76_3700036161 [Vairimorpha ceranae]KAF5140780.1 hypothetical protein G9O61_00g011000 [Vairimorpha ceranae]KKO74983.1 hypothetical protein AAJ76_3700036161 [Vairimorpha ceranae]
MEKNDENIEEILNKYGVKDKFLNSFDAMLTEYDFKSKINTHLKNKLKHKKLEDVSESETYDIIMDFMTKNLPEEVQEKLYYEIRKFIDDNLEF